MRNGQHPHRTRMLDRSEGAPAHGAPGPPPPIMALHPGQEPPAEGDAVVTSEKASNAVEARPNAPAIEPERIALWTETLERLLRLRTGQRPSIRHDPNCDRPGRAA